MATRKDSKSKTTTARTRAVVQRSASSSAAASRSAAWSDDRSKSIGGGRYRFRDGPGAACGGPVGRFPPRDTSTPEEPQ